MKKSRYQIDPLQDCLRDEQAAQEFYKLVNGEYRSRTYHNDTERNFGYFFEPRINSWIVFDNRASTFFVETCRTYKQAEELLIDGTELLAA